MTARIFVDTNILVYTRDASEPDKQKQAMTWMHYLWTSRKGRLSFQVLQEFYVTVTKKLKPGLDALSARRDVQALLLWKPVLINATVLEAAWLLQDRYQLPWWDALITGAAQTAGCTYLLTEDFTEGQCFSAVTVINPFHTSPESLKQVPDERHD